MRTALLQLYRLAVLLGVLITRMNRIFVLVEKLRAALFGVDRRTIEDAPELGFRGRVTKNIDVLFRAIVVAGEDKKFEEESAAPHIRRVVPDLDVQRRNGFLQSSCLVQFPGCHGETSRDRRKVINRPG